MVPGREHVLIRGSTPGRPERSFIESMDGSELTPFTPEGVAGILISRDGKRVIAAGPSVSSPFIRSKGVGLILYSG